MNHNDDLAVGIYPKTDPLPLGGLVLVAAVLGLGLTGAWAILSLLG